MLFTPFCRSSSFVEDTCQDAIAMPAFEDRGAVVVASLLTKEVVASLLIKEDHGDCLVVAGPGRGDSHYFPLPSALGVPPQPQTSWVQHVCSARRSSILLFRVHCQPREIGPHSLSGDALFRGYDQHGQGYFIPLAYQVPPVVQSSLEFWSQQEPVSQGVPLPPPAPSHILTMDASNYGGAGAVPCWRGASG